MNAGLCFSPFDKSKYRLTRKVLFAFNVML